MPSLVILTVLRVTKTAALEAKNWKRPALRCPGLCSCNGPSFTQESVIFFDLISRKAFTLVCEILSP